MLTEITCFSETRQKEKEKERLLKGTDDERTTRLSQEMTEMTDG